MIQHCSIFGSYIRVKRHRSDVVAPSCAIINRPFVRTKDKHIMGRSNPSVAVYGHYGPFGLITTTNQQLQSIAPRRVRLQYDDTKMHTQPLTFTATIGNNNTTPATSAMQRQRLTTKSNHPGTKNTLPSHRSASPSRIARESLPPSYRNPHDNSGRCRRYPVTARQHSHHNNNH